MEKTINRFELALEAWASFMWMWWTEMAPMTHKDNRFEITREGRSIHLVLWDGKVKVGTSTLSWWPGNSTLWVATDLWVHKDYRSVHSGAKYHYLNPLQRIRDWQNMVLEDMGAARVYCTVRADNRLGYWAARRRDYIEQETIGDVVLFFKDL